MAPSPTPVGCEQLPVTEGIFKAESTKAKAPAKPNSIFTSGRWLIVLRMEKKPATRKGKVTAPQRTAHGRGKKPSMMCMA